MVRSRKCVVLTMLLSVSVAVAPGVSFASFTDAIYVHAYGNDAAKFMCETTHDASMATGDSNTASFLSSDATKAESCTSRRILINKRKQLRAFLDASMQRISRIHRRERLEMTGPNQHAIAWAENVVSKIENAIDVLRTQPLTVSVDVWASSQQFIEGTRLSVQGAKQRVATVNRRNADVVLWQAMMNYQLAMSATRIPPGIVDVQKQTSAKYSEVCDEYWEIGDNLFKKATLLARSAETDDSAAEVIQDYADEFDLLLERAKRSIEALDGDRPMFRRAVPTGYYLADSMAKSDHSRTTDVLVVVDVDILCDYFVASPEDYQKTLAARYNLKKTSTSVERIRMLIFRPNDFRLVLPNGRCLVCNEFGNLDSWDGDVLLEPYVQQNAARSLRSSPCVIARKSISQRTMRIQLCWYVPQEMWSEPIELKHKEFTPAPIPGSCQAVDN